MPDRCLTAPQLSQLPSLPSIPRLPSFPSPRVPLSLPLKTHNLKTVTKLTTSGSISGGLVLHSGGVSLLSTGGSAWGQEQQHPMIAWVYAVLEWCCGPRPRHLELEEFVETSCCCCLAPVWPRSFYRSSQPGSSLADRYRGTRTLEQLLSHREHG